MAAMSHEVEINNVLSTMQPLLNADQLKQLSCVLRAQFQVFECRPYHPPVIDG